MLIISMVFSLLLPERVQGGRGGGVHEGGGKGRRRRRRINDVDGEIRTEVGRKFQGVSQWFPTVVRSIPEYYCSGFICTLMYVFHSSGFSLCTCTFTITYQIQMYQAPDMYVCMYARMWYTLYAELLYLIAYFYYVRSCTR